MPFEEEFFDAIISTDSYNYFGRDPEYLEQKLLKHVKHGGYMYISIPGMKQDRHQNIPEELLLSWNEEQLDYIHDVNYWENIIKETQGIEIFSIKEMESNEDVWNDWIECDNEYAQSDKRAIDAGACKYLNFISIVLRRK